MTRPSRSPSPKISSVVSDVDGKLVTDQKLLTERREQVRRHRPWARDQSEMVGGDITVASEPSKGSMFTVRLPVGAPHPDQHSG